MIPPKTSGVLCIAFGIAFVVMSLNMVKEYGKFKLASALLGPLVLVMGGGLLILPTRILFNEVGKTEDGLPVYDYSASGYTQMNMLLAGLGLLLGLGFVAILYFGGL
jgi:hypothetical protein